jgi:TrmH family RNA methyltransferase
MNTDKNDGIVVVLDRPQDAVNIGAVVRAVKNMGFSQLRLVNPRPFDHVELARVAHHAEDIIAAIRVYATLDEAIADTVHVVGTSAVMHSGRPLRRDIEPLSRELVRKSQAGLVAVLFGTEDDGLDKAALDRCHNIAILPTNPAYPALNLAQSVLLCLYELSKQFGTTGEPRPASLLSAPESSRASRVQNVPQAMLEQLFFLIEEALASIGFFKYNPQAVMRTLRQLVFRAELQPQEAALLMAIARQALYAIQHCPGQPGAGGGTSDEQNNKADVA